ncbi:hypothetical protein [Sphingomonas nostoxanthinifaciens]|uniref:hypothetical protein n=1 Tax=Sphingomonas nostoxanthinifaciens TaxID=2872652 RepID=UPI001CC203CC|nr:hypothetical protein [Sphingomonas nostoxanthinifaciens]UAK24172.1 hypothetical protein K8P63_17875 [Sphingomonas nostoxanthinifaciens]
MTPEGIEPAKQAVQHVAVTGFSWSATLLTVLNLLVGSALVTWLKLRPKMAEIEQTADDRLLTTLTTRVEQLERKLDEERQLAASDRRSLEQKLEAERQRHEAEIALQRHRANNSDQCLDAMILLLKNADELPEKVKRAIASVEEMRARQKAEEALEKGAIAGAKLAAVGPQAALPERAPPAA